MIFYLDKVGFVVRKYIIGTKFCDFGERAFLGVLFSRVQIERFKRSQLCFIFKKDEVFSSQNWNKQNAYCFKYKLSLR